MSSSTLNSGLKRKSAEQNEGGPSKRVVLDLVPGRQDGSSFTTVSSLLGVREDSMSYNSLFVSRSNHSSVRRTNNERSNNGRSHGHGSQSNADVRNRSGQARRGRSDSFQRSRATVRPLVPAAPRPNASVFENEQERQNRRRSLDCMFTRRSTTSATCQSGGQLSNQGPEQLLRVDPGLIHVGSQYNPNHGYVPTTSGAGRLQYANGIAQTNLPATTPQMMGISQPHWPANLNGNQGMSSMGPPNGIMPQSYSNRPQLATSQFSIAPVPQINFGQLQSQSAGRMASIGYPLDNGYTQAQSVPGYARAGWLPSPVQTSQYAATDQMYIFNQQAVQGNSQLQYAAPLQQHTAPYSIVFGQDNPNFPEYSHFSAPENNGQFFEQPSQPELQGRDALGAFSGGLMNPTDAFNLMGTGHLTQSVEPPSGFAVDNSEPGQAYDETGDKQLFYTLWNGNHRL